MHCRHTQNKMILLSNLEQSYRLSHLQTPDQIGELISENAVAWKGNGNWVVPVALIHYVHFCQPFTKFVGLKMND